MLNNVYHHVDSRARVGSGEEKEISKPIVADWEISPVDPVCIDDDSTVSRLAKDRFQTRDSNVTRGDHVSQNIACTDGGKLIHVAYKEDVRRQVHCLE